MRSYRTVLMLLLIVSVTGIVALVSSFQGKESFAAVSVGQKKKKPERLVDIPSLQPIDAMPQERDFKKNAERENKNKRYNLPDSSFDLAKQVDGEASGRVPESNSPPPFPVGDSDLIIIGKIIKRQPYLAENRTSIYSEFRVQLEDVLKNNAHSLVTAGDMIVADREGGAIRMPDGRVLRYLVDGIGSMPEVGKRYVLFLKNESVGTDYVIICGYKLEGGKAQPLEEISDRALYIDFPEPDFLDIIKEAITQNGHSKSVGGGF